MIIKPKILPTKVFFPQYSAPSTPVDFAAGKIYATDVIDRTTSPTFAELVEIGLRASAGTVTGDVKVYVYGSFTGNTTSVPGYTNEPTTATAFYDGQVILSPKNAPNKWQINDTLTDPTTGWKLAGSFTPAAATGKPSYFSFNVASLFGGVVPMKFVILAHNNTDGALKAMASNHWCQVTGLQVETV